MTKRAVVWWVLNGWVPVAMTALTLYWLAEGNWGMALTTGIFALGGLVWIQTNIYTFRTGWLRGGKDTMEALNKAESRDEYLRLTETPPRPWR